MPWISRSSTRPNKGQATLTDINPATRAYSAYRVVIIDADGQDKVTRHKPSLHLTRLIQAGGQRWGRYHTPGTSICPPGMRQVCLLSDRDGWIRPRAWSAVAAQPVCSERMSGQARVRPDGGRREEALPATSNGHAAAADLCSRSSMIFCIVVLAPAARFSAGPSAGK